MRYRIYHSLDRPTSFFGIKGRYLGVLGAGALASLVLALLVGTATQMILGLGALMAGCAVAYLATVWAQARTDERDLMKAVGHRRLPLCWSVRPRALRNIWKGID